MTLTARKNAKQSIGGNKSCNLLGQESPEDVGIIRNKQGKLLHIQEV